MMSRSSMEQIASYCNGMPPQSFHGSRLWTVWYAKNRETHRILDLCLCVCLCTCTQHVPDWRVRCLHGQTCRCVVWNPYLIHHLFSSFAFFFPLCLSTDNMVDQTKVETSEAKAKEMEKKVKYTQIHWKSLMPTHITTVCHTITIIFTCQLRSSQAITIKENHTL